MLKVYDRYWQALYLLGHNTVEGQSDAYKQALKRAIAKYGDDSDSMELRKRYIAKRLGFAFVD